MLCPRHVTKGADLSNTGRIFPHRRVPLPRTWYDTKIGPPTPTQPVLRQNTAGWDGASTTTVAEQPSTAEKPGEASPSSQAHPPGTYKTARPFGHVPWSQAHKARKEGRAKIRARIREQVFAPRAPVAPVAPVTHGPFTVRNQLKRIFFGGWMNVLLLCCPAAFALNYAKGQTVETFAVSFAASIPLSLMSEMALAEIALRLGKTLEQLLYLFTR